MANVKVRKTGQNWTVYQGELAKFAHPNKETAQKVADILIAETVQEEIMTGVKNIMDEAVRVHGLSLYRARLLIRRAAAEKHEELTALLKETS